LKILGSKLFKLSFYHTDEHTDTQAGVLDVAFFWKKLLAVINTQNRSNIDWKGYRYYTMVNIVHGLCNLIWYMHFMVQWSRGMNVKMKLTIFHATEHNFPKITWSHLMKRNETKEISPNSRTEREFPMVKILP
jgi:hypothetical protein